MHREVRRGRISAQIDAAQFVFREESVWTVQGLGVSIWDIFLIIMFTIPDKIPHITLSHRRPPSQHVLTDNICITSRPDPACRVCPFRLVVDPCMPKFLLPQTTLQWRGQISDSWLHDRSFNPSTEFATLPCLLHRREPRQSLPLASNRLKRLSTPVFGRILKGIRRLLSETARAEVPTHPR